MAIVAGSDRDGTLHPKSGQTLFLQWTGEKYPLEQLDPFTFTAISAELTAKHAYCSGQDIYDGVIGGLIGSVDIQFRIRQIDEDRLICSFYDLTIAKRDQLIGPADRAGAAHADALQSLSYDELAKGNTTNTQSLGRAKNGVFKELPDKDSSIMTKSIVSAALVLAMLIIGGWVVMVGRSQSTISVANSVMVGNYQAVNAPLEGKLVDLRVAIGDRVKAGQIMATISNPKVEHELKVIETQIARAKRDLAAHRRQAKETASMLEMARNVLQTKRLVAIATRNRIKSDLRSARSQVKRLALLKRRKRVVMRKFEEAVALKDRWVAELEGQNATIKGIALSQKGSRERRDYTGWPHNQSDVDNSH